MMSRAGLIPIDFLRFPRYRHARLGGAGFVPLGGGLRQLNTMFNHKVNALCIYFLRRHKKTARRRLVDMKKPALGGPGVALDL